MLLLRTVSFLVFASCASAFFVNLRNLGSDLEKKYNLEFLKDYLKFPIYINPHPHCALEDEECTLDTNCCGGLECKMAVDREGLKYTCQGKVGEGGDSAGTDGREADEWDEGWQEDDSNSLLREIYRTRLDQLNKEEQRLVDDQYYMIKELQKPISFEEMRELQNVKEVDDYKRENELRELRRWAQNKKAQEKEKIDLENKLKELAKERVSKVLKEEKQQKEKMFKEFKDQMYGRKSWF